MARVGHGAHGGSELLHNHDASCQQVPGRRGDFKWLQNPVLLAVLGHKEFPSFPSSLFQKF